MQFPTFSSGNVPIPTFYSFSHLCWSQNAHPTVTATLLCTMDSTPSSQYMYTLSMVLRVIYQYCCLNNFSMHLFLPQEKHSDRICFKIVNVAF